MNLTAHKDYWATEFLVALPLRCAESLWLSEMALLLLIAAAPPGA
jgi:hypothetical protein